MDKGKDRAKTDTELLFEKMNPDLPRDSSKYKFGKSYKDPKTGEIKVELILKEAKKNKRYKGGLMVKPKAAKRGY